MGASSGPKAIRDRIEIRLEDRLQHQLEGHLDQFVSERRNAQRTELSRLALASGSASAEQVVAGNSLSQSCRIFPESLRHDRVALRSPFASRDPCPVYCCPGYGPAVAKREARFAVDTMLNTREPFLRVRSTPPIQLALHVENEPGIHRVGQVVHLLLARFIHCLPSPCGRLSRPRTTTQAPSPLRVIAGRFGRPSPMDGNARGFPSSTVAPRPL